MSHIHLLAYRFLDYEGGQSTFGGMQRYAYNLVRLLETLGHECTLYQKADFPWERSLLLRSRVVGIPSSRRASGNLRFNIAAHQQIPEDAPVIYVCMEMALPRYRRRSVAIQHGIWWDGEMDFFKRKISEFQMRIAVRHVRRVICVDTNFINWFRCLGPRQKDLDKLTYVPNFADSRHFGDPPRFAHGASEEVTVLFPRRSEIRRGLFLMADATAALLNRHSNLRVRFLVGSGYLTEDLNRRLEAKGILPDDPRIGIDSLPFERMGEAYRTSDIVVIPTLFSEGTSLSCIEAMHHGCSIVATHIGGLGNLVLDGFNGLLTDPKEECVTAAIEKLIGDPKLRQRLGDNAYITARESFSLEIWESRISRILTEAFES